MISRTGPFIIEEYHLRGATELIREVYPHPVLGRTFLLWFSKYLDTAFITMDISAFFVCSCTISLMKIVQEQTKKKDTEIQLLKDKQKELEFLNAMLSDRLTLAQRKQFGASSEKYAEGYEQMNLFNEAEASADAETEELFEEIREQ